MDHFTPEPTAIPSFLLTMISMPSILLTILIPLVCFVVVLLLLRFAARTRWLTAIAASAMLSTILWTLGVRMMPTPSDARLKIGWGVFPLAAAISVLVLILIVKFFRWLFTTEAVQANVNTAERSRILT